MRFKKALLATVIATLIAGCAATRESHRNIEARSVESGDIYKQNVAALFPPLKKPVNVMAEPVVTPESSPITVKNEAFRRDPKAVTSIPVVSKDAKAAQLKETVAITRQFSNLLEITDWIRELYNIPVRGSSDILELTVPADRLRFINFQGSLEHFLDALSMRTGVAWTVKEGALVLAVQESRTYIIDASPGDTFLQTALSVQGSVNNGGTSASGSSQGTVQSNTQVSANISVWTGVERSVTGMLSKAGKYTLSQATGLLVVTDRPEVHERVAEYVNETNKRLNMQVVINIRSFVVKKNAGDNYGINWAAVYTSLTQKYGFAVSNTFDILATGTSAVFSILPNSNIRNGQFNSSEAVFNALSSINEVSNISDSTIATVNGLPAPLHIGTQTTYLAAVTSTQTANVGSQATLTPGVVNSGLVLNVTPVVLNNKDIKLQFSMDLSSLLGITKQSSGGNSIQTPALDRRSSLQTVIVRNGEAMVIAGSQQSVDQSDKKGTGSASNFFAGGGVNASTTSETLVVVITARVPERKVIAENVAALR